ILVTRVLDLVAIASLICYSTNLSIELTQYRIVGDGAAEIAASIERGIEAGALRPGTPLPAVRALAGDLGVSPTTVAAAFKDLRSRGLVVTRPRSGAQVSWRPPVAGAWLGSAAPAGTRDLASGNPDPDLLPDLTPVLRRIEPPRQLYGGDPADPQLLEQAGEEFDEVGIAGEMAVVSGALDGIERALEAQVRPGDLVAVEDPGFAGLFDLLRALGLALRPVTVDGRGMVPAALADALEEGVSAIVVNPRGQNPTGASLDRERAVELRRVLDRDPEVMVLEDDHLGPIAGAPRLTLTSGRRRWAAARSLAKSLGPDLRLAVLAGDAGTISRVRGRQAVGPGWVSHLLQRIAAELIADTDVARLLDRAAATYRERREAFLAALAEHGIEVEAPSGLNVWIPVPDETSVVQSLQAEGWAVAPGAPFRLRSKPAIRVTISTLEASEAGALAAAIAQALQPSRRTRSA
ncbi:MAG TPA: aminotransferase class I/II-fold pyridoxal phosphate-dependent enzyme, partial [Solirubrobacterales bacterium]|nr:aminotransferase class I/II-fold pyridoxal phosphate-dependent enzyme [Solirubrobacterales bacterium]